MEEFRIGEHTFRWEPPDLVFLTYRGDLDGESVAQLGQISRRFTTSQPYVLLLVDLSRIGKVAAEARKRSSEGSHGVPLRGMAIVGASRTLRVVASLLARAVDLLYRNTDNPTRFFATEAEARTWLAERRRAVFTALAKTIREPRKR